MRILSLYDFGIVSLGKSIFQSFEFSHFGIRYGMDRMLPVENTLQKKNELYISAYKFSVLSSLVFISFWIIYEWNNSLIIYLAFIISGFLNTLLNITRIYYRTFNDKKLFIRITFLINIVPLVTEGIGCFINGFRGFIIGFFIGYFITYLIVQIKYRLKIDISTNLLLINIKNLFSIGFIMFVSGVLSFLVSAGDRFFIANYWGNEQVGLFGIAMFFFSALSIFSTAYTEMIMSNIIQNKSFRYIVRHLLFVIIFSIVMVIIVNILCPVFFKIIMPKYLQYVDTIRIILYATIPFSMLPILNYYLHALDKRKIMLVINGIVSIIYLAVLIIVLTNNNPNVKALLILKDSYYFIITLITGIISLYFSRKSVCL